MIFIGNFQPFCSVVYCCSSIWNRVFSTSGDLSSNVGDSVFLLFLKLVLIHFLNHIIISGHYLTIYKVFVSVRVLSFGIGSARSSSSLGSVTTYDLSLFHGCVRTYCCLITAVVVDNRVTTHTLIIKICLIYTKDQFFF